MAELQLKVVKNTNDGIWGKALNNFNKVLYSSGGGLFNIVINSKRNSLLRAHQNYENIVKMAKENKRKAVADKYEKSYENYLDILERYIKETVYTRVQKKISTLKENRLLSNYYEVNALKGTDYCEYKYRIQILLLGMDWEYVLASKSENFVEKYKKFYVNVIDQLYRSTMRHYSIKLTNKKEPQDGIYKGMYDTVEAYIKEVLPYAEQSDECKKIIESYKSYVEKIDMYVKKEINSVKRELYLIELGMNIFEYSLPILAAEECYLDIIEKTRLGIINTYIVADKFELYTILVDAIESYCYNILARKTIWDKPMEKEEFDKFWDKFMEYKKLERIDFHEYKRLREVLFIKADIRKIKATNKNYKELLAYYRERMKQQGGLRKFKSTMGHMDGVWRTRRRCQAS